MVQLGLLPVCPDENYYFFESRSYGGAAHATLGRLTRDWMQATFGVADERAYIAPAITWRPTNDTTLTLLSDYQHDVTGNAFPQSVATVRGGNQLTPYMNNLCGGVFVVDLPPELRAYNDQPVTCGQSYDYYLVGINPSGGSAWPPPLGVEAQGICMIPPRK